MNEVPNQKKSLLKRFWWIILIIVVSIIILVVFWFGQKSKPSEEDESRVGSTSANTGQIQCPPTFVYDFTDISKIDAFQPLGSLSGASRGRSYITISKGQTVPVYLPLDATLKSIIYAYRGPDAPEPEYGFKFDIGCSMTLLLDHVDFISDELRQYAPTEATRSTATDDNLSVKIKGGSLLGQSNGTPQARTFDFLVMDYNLKVNYIKPSRWQWDQSKYAVCPYDYYGEPQKQAYYAKLGENTDLGLKKSIDCGKLSYDMDDTISGGWFADENATDTKGKFMLIGERLGVVDLIVKNDSEGTSFRVTDYSPKILPVEVGVGEAVCYGGNGGNWAYVLLPNKDTIKLVTGSGKCPNSFSGSNTQVFYR